MRHQGALLASLVVKTEQKDTFSPKQKYIRKQKQSLLTFAFILVIVEQRSPTANLCHFSFPFLGEGAARALRERMCWVHTGSEGAEIGSPVVRALLGVGDMLPSLSGSSRQRTKGRRAHRGGAKQNKNRKWPAPGFSVGRLGNMSRYRRTRKKNGTFESLGSRLRC